MQYSIRLGLSSIAVLWFLWSPVSAQQAPVSRPQPTSTSVSIPKRGVFYEVRSARNVAYLFGTVHMGRPDYYPLHPSVTNALSSSKRLAVEADPTDASGLAQHMMEFALYQPPARLDQHIPAPLMRRLEAVLGQYNLTKEHALAMKPWTIMMTLGVLEATRQGYDGNQGVDGYLIKYAKSKNIPIVELEGLRRQFEIFAALTDEQQRVFLDESLQEFENGTGKVRMTALMKAWETADRAALEREWTYMKTSPLQSYKFTAEKLVKQRNIAMANRIDEFLRSPDAHFVAVGALHLVGESSIAELLKQRGYSVREL